MAVPFVARLLRTIEVVVEEGEDGIVQQEEAWSTLGMEEAGVLGSKEGEGEGLQQQPEGRR